MALFRHRSDAPPVADAIVRPAGIGDAAAVVRLSRALSLEDGGRASQLTEDAFRRDGFGDNPAFRALVAQSGDAVVGYALYFPGYDTDRASRGIYLADLYVAPDHRRAGVGGALIKGAARACRDAGGSWMFWSVLKRNKGARKFYRRLAPELRDVVLCAAIADTFQRLAE
ncbi:MAG: GNAT family N-acetyltransferase [Alphaproteobacteria bacterium]